MNDDRRAWWTRLQTMVRPVFAALAAGRLRADLPVESKPGLRDDRALYTHLEAIGRSLAGCAPWLVCPQIDDADEAAARDELRGLVHAGLQHFVDPTHPDCGNFSRGHQPVVDAAFLAHGFLRGPDLWRALPTSVQEQLVVRLKETRSRRPHRNNWLLFGGIVEACLAHFGIADWDPMRVDYAVAQHEQWYAGDGVYGDGPRFHADYYNSFVIHPMLFDILRAVEPVAGCGHLTAALPAEQARFARYAVLQERCIAPDGSYPPVGRSLAYRCGAFQHLAMAALLEILPEGCTWGGLRAALAAVIRRTLDAPGTYDEAGWLTIGLAGHQPGIGENYISTGSTYLAANAFLPLGLPASHAFWTAPSAPWTSRRLFELGEDLPCDHALRD